jgi:Protein of unknown function (DUF2795)
MADWTLDIFFKRDVTMSKTFLEGGRDADSDRTDFPKTKAVLVKYARHNLDNRKKAEYTLAAEVLKALEKLPSRKYSSMADVEHEVGALK